MRVQWVLLKRSEVRGRQRVAGSTLVQGAGPVGKGAQELGLIPDGSGELWKGIVGGACNNQL